MLFSASVLPVGVFALALVLLPAETTAADKKSKSSKSTKLAKTTKKKDVYTSASSLLDVVDFLECEAVTPNILPLNLLSLKGDLNQIQSGAGGWASQPHWSIRPTNASKALFSDATALFTIVSVDVGAWNEDAQNPAVTLHYLSTDMQSKAVGDSASLFKFSETLAPLTPYSNAKDGVAFTADSRMVTLLIHQASTYTDTTTAVNATSDFDLQSFITSNNIGKIIAANMDTIDEKKFAYMPAAAVRAEVDAQGASNSTTGKQVIPGLSNANVAGPQNAESNLNAASVDFGVHRVGVAALVGAVVFALL